MCYNYYNFQLNYIGAMKKYKYKFEYKPKRKGKYGYIEFVDERELKHDGFDDNIYPEIRKPTPDEREEIILNYIRANSGQPVCVWWLAEKLGVSDRTIQKILKKFEEQGLISRTPLFTETGKQQGNILTYLGEDKEISETDLTLTELYNPDNPCGFRDWHWRSFKFIPGVYDENFTKSDAHNQYFHLRWLKEENEKKRKNFRKE